jgi:hypothetical protein
MVAADVTQQELCQQIAKKLATISRLEAKARRCNTDSELGRALAARAENSATHQRKLLGKLQERLAALKAPLVTVVPTKFA